MSESLVAHLSRVVAEVEGACARVEAVRGMRERKGKPPLGRDAGELAERLSSAALRLGGAVGSGVGELESEFRRLVGE